MKKKIVDVAKDKRTSFSLHDLPATLQVATRSKSAQAGPSSARRDLRKNATKHDLDSVEWYLTLPHKLRELLEAV